MNHTPKRTLPLQNSSSGSLGTASIESRQPQKNRRRLVLILGISALVVGLSGVAIGQIRNSKHDFSSSGKGGIWGSADINQICIFCHTPHRATTTTALWNRTNPTATFKTYNLPSNLPAPAQPTIYSRRCLACHDGSVAIDAFNAGRTGVPKMMAIGDVYYPGSPWGEGGANIGGNYNGNSSVNDLSDDHPISVLYDSTVTAANSQLKDPAAIGLPLFDDAGKKRVECSTCHDVHNNSGGFSYLLRATLDQSALCLSCHIK